MSASRDVYAESNNRLPLPKREEMDDYAKKVYDSIIIPEHRWDRLRGPFGVLLHSPRLAELENALNHYLRFESGIDGRLRELAILVTAREMNSQFEWTMHEPIALNEGLAPEIIDVVKHRKTVAGLGENESVIVQLGRELFGQRKVTAETFSRALTLFGTKQLVDLVALMSDYSAIAAVICAFNIQPGEGQKPLLPTP